MAVAILEKEGHSITELCGLWKKVKGKLVNKYIEEGCWESLTLVESGDTFEVHDEQNLQRDLCTKFEFGEADENGWSSIRGVSNGKYLTATSCQTVTFQNHIHEGVNAEDILVNDIPLHEFKDGMSESLQVFLG